jgi:hypothetical protein
MATSGQRKDEDEAEVYEVLRLIPGLPSVLPGDQIVLYGGQRASLWRRLSLEIVAGATKGPRAALRSLPLKSETSQSPPRPPTSRVPSCDWFAREPQCLPVMIVSSSTSGARLRNRAGGKGWGFASQESRIRAHCVAQGLALADLYTDAGVSGKTSLGLESPRAFQQGISAHLLRCEAPDDRLGGSGEHLHGLPRAGARVGGHGSSGVRTPRDSPAPRGGRRVPGGTAPGRSQGLSGRDGVCHWERHYGNGAHQK